jgi:hypothetical protein
MYLLSNYWIDCINNGEIKKKLVDRAFAICFTTLTSIQTTLHAVAGRIVNNEL